ncbi:hypothetical protein [Sphingomonas swuensis]|uniref:hypothetical protein n=1 Tax=Sphingomonas swuensis TaxID=977800 RepID=UPI0031D4B48F
MIASHYAVPLVCTLVRDTVLTSTPAADGEPLAELASGEQVQILDNSRGWAWGYGGGLVGYIPASAL